MLSTVEVPENLEQLADEARRLSQQIRAAVSSYLRPERLESNTDLMSRFGGDVVFIDDGMLKLTQDGKLARGSSWTGIYSSFPRSRVGLRAASDFVTELSVCSAEDFAACMTADAAFAQSSLQTMQTYEEVLAGLCAAASSKRVEPNSELKRYESGDVILRRGATTPT